MIRPIHKKTALKDSVAEIRRYEECLWQRTRSRNPMHQTGAVEWLFHPISSGDYQLFPLIDPSIPYFTNPVLQIYTF